MKKLYQVQIIEAYYEDDYENGEVDGTFQAIPLSTTTTDDPAEAVAAFAQLHGTDGKVWVDDDMVHADSMKTATGYGWRKPTEQEIAAWTRGEMKLWNVEHQLKIRELTPVEGEQLEALAKDFLAD